MIDTGQLLRQQREAQGLSLADVEAQTRIRGRYLEALEAGDWNELPNEVVARGFLRTYARFLGLDDAELLTESATTRAKPATETPAADVDPADPAYQPIDLDLYADPTGDAHRTRRIVRLVIVILVVALVFVMLVRFALPVLQDLAAPVAEPASTVTLPTPGAQPTTPLIASENDTPAPVQTPTAIPGVLDAAATDTPSRQPTNTVAASPTRSGPTPSPTPVSQITMRLSVSQRSWVRLDVDGQTLVEGILSAGFAETYIAARGIDLLTGNGAGVSVTVNGKTDSPLGENGQIVRVTWVIDEGVIIASTPVFSPLETPATAEPAAVATETAEETPTPGS